MSKWGKGTPHAWLKVRAEVLERDDYRCRLELPGCMIEAEQVDHIDNLAALGIDRRDPIALDPDRCISVCAPCHAKKTAAEGHAARRARNKRKPYIHPSKMVGNHG